MMIFEAIDAGHGDALLVRYQGNTDYERILLIDGGPSKTGEHNSENGEGYNPLTTRILPRLCQIKAERDARSPDEDNQSGESKLHIDLVVCTHVHDDHIDGIVQLFGAQAGLVPMPENGNILSMPWLWHNSFSKLMVKANIDVATTPGMEVVSIRDGQLLSNYANKLKTDINPGAPRNLIDFGFKPDQFASAVITVLTPGKRELTKLQKAWVKEVGAANAISPVAVHETVNEIFDKDVSVLNLSSIAMLIELDGQRILLTGDQRGDYVMKALEDLKLKKPGETFEVDIMKVPHHGSKANVQRNFIKGIPAKTYVFSANGKDQNPDPEVLQFVAEEAASGRDFTMAFTNGTMNYVPQGSEYPKFIGGPEVKTLQEAIAHLKTLPGVSDNVTFKFREEDAHSVIINL